jgi:hypothetical protein
MARARQAQGAVCESTSEGTMSEQLTAYDIEVIMMALELARTQHEQAEYLSHELRESQLKRINDVVAKVQSLRDDLRDKPDPTA